MSNLIIRIPAANPVKSSLNNLVQTILVSAGFTNAYTGKIDVSSTDHSGIFVSLANKNFRSTTYPTDYGSGTELTMPQDLTKLQEHLVQKEVKIVDDNSGYEIVIKPDGLVQFGCTGARPTVVKNLIELRKKVKAGTVTPKYGDADYEIPVFKIQAEDAELVYAAYKYLDGIHDFELDDEDMGEDDIDTELFIFADRDEQGDIYYYASTSMPDNGKDVLKKNTLTLPNGWTKMADTVLTFLNEAEVVVEEVATTSLDKNPTTIKIGDYWVTAHKDGRLFINGESQEHPEEDGEEIEAAIVEKVIAAWVKTPGAQKLTA